MEAAQRFGDEPNKHQMWCKKFTKAKCWRLETVVLSARKMMRTLVNNGRKKEEQNENEAITAAAMATATAEEKNKSTNKKIKRHILLTFIVFPKLGF